MRARRAQLALLWVFLWTTLISPTVGQVGNHLYHTYLSWIVLKVISNQVTEGSLPNDTQVQLGIVVDEP